MYTLGLTRRHTLLEACLTNTTHTRTHLIPPLPWGGACHLIHQRFSSSFPGLRESFPSEMPQFIVTKVDDEEGEVEENGQKRGSTGQIWNPCEITVSGEQVRGRTEGFP